MEAARPARNHDVNQSFEQSRSAYDLLIANRSLRPLGRTLIRAAMSDVPVLILGESGTGKELVAKAIHERSYRATMPFVCLNLASVPLELAETVLFGHEKGAFTGATSASPGYCRRANGGTLFLDEIGETDWSLQSKLLRFLQSREIQPVGSHGTAMVDVRIVAATNRDLVQAIRDRQFREDLFYRLNVVQFRLPPLRDRSEDIDDLVDFFLQEFNQKYGRNCTFSASLRERMCAGQWPGNVRQLRSLVESLVLLSEQEILGVQHLSREFLLQIGFRNAEPDQIAGTTSASELSGLTFALIESVLQQTNWHVTSAAKRLGISRATLYRWLKRYRIERIRGPGVDLLGSSRTQDHH